MNRPLENPWLVAVWPGMGSVALAAGHYLCEQLGAERVTDLAVEAFFDADKIDIDMGLVSMATPPQHAVHVWRDPRRRRDLVVLNAEAQPNARGLDLCRTVLDELMPFGLARVCTFAAMGTQQRPDEPARVFAVANDRQLVDELRRYPVELLEKGQITGLNGLLLAASAERKIPAFCLLGEMPFLAGGLPNPRASMRVLEVFSQIADLPLDLNPLGERARAAQQELLRLLEQMTLAAQQIAQQPAAGTETEKDTFTIPDFFDFEDEVPGLGRDDRERIEQLFRASERDRSQVLRLKAELDRLGVFSQFENRFLDLFKRGE
ncbi:MAG: PAC2 family protein [Planctomycetota bacterium]